MSNKPRRVLSPHLTIYKPQISSVLSIMHRATGVFNFFGMVAFVWWIVFVVYTLTPYGDTWVWKFFSSDYGVCVLVVWTFSLFFHLCTGLRHLFWDIGWGYGIRTMTITGYLAVTLAALLTLYCWMLIEKQF